jgi:hypothetical protein
MDSRDRTETIEERPGGFRLVRMREGYCTSPDSYSEPVALTMKRDVIHSQELKLTTTTIRARGRASQTGQFNRPSIEAPKPRFADIGVCVCVDAVGLDDRGPGHRGYVWNEHGCTDKQNAGVREILLDAQCTDMCL